MDWKYELTNLEGWHFGGKGSGIDEEFAFLEGEGDRSYIYWKTANERFFTDYGKEIGLDWNLM